MSDMKCPFCQQELRKIHPTYVICDNCRITGEDKLWQELIRTKELFEIEDAEHSMCHTQMLKTTEKLERTRKALAVAKDAIDEILVLDSGKFIQEPAEMWKIAKSAKDKITALE